MSVAARLAIWQLLPLGGGGDLTVQPEAHIDITANVSASVDRTVQISSRLSIITDVSYTVTKTVTIG